MNNIHYKPNFKIFCLKNRLGTKPQIKNTQFSFLFEIITKGILTDNIYEKKPLIKMKKNKATVTCTIFFCCLFIYFKTGSH